MAELFTAPDIRTATAKEYQTHLEEVRANRNLLSQEYLSSEKKKFVKKGTAAHKKWENASERVKKKLAKMDEMITAIEKDLATMAVVEDDIQTAEKMND